MSSGQLIKMVAAEALTYVLSGMLLGCVVGLPLHRLLYQSMITSRWEMSGRYREQPLP